MTKFDENAFTEAFNDTYASDDEGPAPGRLRGAFRSSGGRTRAVIIGTGIAAIGITGVVGAATGDNIREGIRNGTTSSETEIVSNINSTTALKGGYSTRQSNLSSTGGGAIYGCRSTEGTSTSNPPRNPCLRANNLSNGFAFEFNATNGSTGGAITVGSGGDEKKPFVTNATGVATGLNADRVDGVDATTLVATSAADATNKADAAKTRWALIDENGVIVAQSGGMTVVTAYPGGDGPGGNQNVYINTGVDATKRGLGASIAIQNTNQDGVANNFGGEISLGACGFDTINCAPENTENANTIVVSPRGSDGAVTTEGARKRFYVHVTNE